METTGSEIPVVTIIIRKKLKQIGKKINKFIRITWIIMRIAYKVKSHCPLNVVYTFISKLGLCYIIRNSFKDEMIILSMENK